MCLQDGCPVNKPAAAAGLVVHYQSTVQLERSQVTLVLELIHRDTHKSKVK